jgi:hypothetical protein
MSLINEMLKNLDQRRAINGETERSALSGLTPAPASATQQRMRSRLFLMNGAVLFGCLFIALVITTNPPESQTASTDTSLEAVLELMDITATEEAADSWLARASPPMVSTGPGPEPERLEIPAASTQ